MAVIAIEFQLEVQKEAKVLFYFKQRIYFKEFYFI